MHYFMLQSPRHGDEITLIFSSVIATLGSLPRSPSQTVCYLFIPLSVFLPRSDHAALVLELRGVQPPPPHAPCAASSARDRRFNDRSQRSLAAMFAAGRRKPKPDAVGGPAVREPCISTVDPAPGRACQGEPVAASSGTLRSPSKPAVGHGLGPAAEPDLAEPAGAQRAGQHGLHEAPLGAGEAGGASSSGALPLPGAPGSARKRQASMGPPAEASGAGASGEHTGAAEGGPAAGAPGAVRGNEAAIVHQETSMPGSQQCTTARAARSASHEEPGQVSGDQRQPEPKGGGGSGVGGSGGSAQAGARERKRPAGLRGKEDPKPSPAKKRAASGGGAAEAAGQRSIRSFFGGAGAEREAKQG